MTSDSAERDLEVSQRQATILVVEDEIIIRTAVSEELRQQGYKVIEAGTAEEALSILRSVTFVDGVVTDLRMPGSLDGGDLVRLVRAEFAGLKVIMVSGHEPEADVRRLLDGYLSKPVPPSALVRCLRTLMRSQTSVEGADE
jgi:CheY-like chemotaxis protein